MSASAAEKRGFLTKLGGAGIRKTWRKRWFALDGTLLFYAKAPNVSAAARHGQRSPLPRTPPPGLATIATRLPAAPGRGLARFLGGRWTAAPECSAATQLDRPRRPPWPECSAGPGA
jgi:hypothetical protein